MSSRSLLLLVAVGAGLSTPAVAQKQAMTMPALVAVPAPPRATASGTPEAAPLSFGQSVTDRVNTDGR